MSRDLKIAVFFNFNGLYFDWYECNSQRSQRKSADYDAKKALTKKDKNHNFEIMVV